jgi:hypothetical protein
LNENTGGGKWSTPVNITNNAASQSFAHRETGGGNAVATSSTYRPEFAEATALENGGVGILMVNTEWTILGITNAAATDSGRVVGALRTASIAKPWVLFRKLQ